MHYRSLKLIMGIFIFSTVLNGAEAWADSSQPAAAPAQDDKLDVSGLEKKYWSAKDTDFSVVQNRLYSKANRFSLSAAYGMYANDPWSTGPTYAFSSNYYFSERYGVELDYSTTMSTDNDATANLKTTQDGAPNHNKMKQFYGTGFNWVPFYAKMSVLNSSITYFDMSITPGIGMVEYQQQLQSNDGASMWTPCFTLDITEQFFVNNHWAIRFDIKNRWYNEQVTQYNAPVTGRTTWNNSNQTTLFDLGLTFFF